MSKICPFSQKEEGFFWAKIRNFFSKNREVNSEILRAVLSTTVDSIITINEEHLMISFNKAAETMFGFTAKEMIGKNINELMPEPFHSEHDAYIQNYLKTGVKKIIGIGRETVAKRKDGSTFPIDLAVSEVIVRKQRLFTGIIRDISQRKKAEEEKLISSRIQAEMTTKNEYLSILGHELRTPLTSIYGSLSLLMRESDFSEKGKELVTIAYRVSLRLKEIVADILDIEKMQFAKIKLTLSPVVISSAIREGVAIVKGVAEQREVRIT